MIYNIPRQQNIVNADSEGKIPNDKLHIQFSQSDNLVESDLTFKINSEKKILEESLDLTSTNNSLNYLQNAINNMICVPINNIYKNTNDENVKNI